MDGTHDANIPYDTQALAGLEDQFTPKFDAFAKPDMAHAKQEYFDPRNMTVAEQQASDRRRKAIGGLVANIALDIKDETMFQQAQGIGVSLMDAWNSNQMLQGHIQQQEQMRRLLLDEIDQDDEVRPESRSASGKLTPKDKDTRRTQAPRRKPFFTKSIGSSRPSVNRS